MNKLPFEADTLISECSTDGTAEALLWWRHVPELPQQRLGVIGGFHATTAPAARALLSNACERLRQEGCTTAIGPMDGNTWRKYRFVTESGGEPPFFLEPVNPPEWPGWWRAAGFSPLAEYYSAACENLTARDERLDGFERRMAALGITARSFLADDFEGELGRIYDVSVISFRENFLYTPLPRGEFLAQYAALQGRLRPELVLLAEHAGRPIGYVFALPDYAQAKTGEPITTVIVKTLAVLPGRTYAGLGAWLLAEVHRAAERLGFSRVIHALMHESNRSRNLSAHYARTLRRYTLFARKLVP